MNLPKNPTMQQVYDYVATHLLTQGERAVQSTYTEINNCRYRASLIRGEKQMVLKCAVGCLISDEDYDRKIEGKGVRVLAVAGSTGNFEEGHARLHDILDKLGLTQPKMLWLLVALQSLHDATNPGTWPNELKIVAAGYDLDYKVVDDFVNNQIKEPA